MKTEKEIRDYLNWLHNAVYDSDNDTPTQQAQLWAKIDFIENFLKIRRD